MLLLFTSAYKLWNPPLAMYILFGIIQLDALSNILVEKAL